MKRPVDKWKILIQKQKGLSRRVDRVEYDFGEVVLEINGKVSKYYMAVFGALASKYRWAYLYTNQKKEVFMDSHLGFFEQMGGVYKELEELLPVVCHFPLFVDYKKN